MAAAPCVFCGIVARDLPATVVREDEKTLAFLTVEPATEGHTLVIPKRHSRNLFDVGLTDLAAVAAAAQEVALWQREQLECAGVTLYQANEPAGFQTVFHYHVHVVPRYPDDGVANAWRDVPRATHEELAAVARRLRGEAP
ncbi:MAG: HIT family protein [Candidatus Limnocylindria bacterium]